MTPRAGPFEAQGKLKTGLYKTLEEDYRFAPKDEMAR
jgi:hypothetical protein